MVWRRFPIREYPIISPPSNSIATDTKDSGSIDESLNKDKIINIFFFLNVFNLLKL